jgi:hypothetical protein
MPKRSVDSNIHMNVGIVKLEALPVYAEVLALAVTDTEEEAAGVIGAFVSSTIESSCETMDATSIEVVGVGSRDSTMDSITSSTLEATSMAETDEDSDDDIPLDGVGEGEIEELSMDEIGVEESEMETLSLEEIDTEALSTEDIDREELPMELDALWSPAERGSAMALSDEADAAAEDTEDKLADGVGVGELASDETDDADDKTSDDDSTSDADALLDTWVLLADDTSLDEKLFTVEEVGVGVGSVEMLPPNPKSRDDGRSVELTTELDESLTEFTGDEVAEDDSLPP